MSSTFLQKLNATIDPNESYAEKYLSSALDTLSYVLRTDPNTKHAIIGDQEYQPDYDTICKTKAYKAFMENMKENKYNVGWTSKSVYIAGVGNVREYQLVYKGKCSGRWFW